MSAGSNQARELFLAAVKLAPDLWDAYLKEACGGDEALRDRVHNLLVAHKEAGSFLEPAVAALAVPNEEPVSERPGTVIGPYKLLQQIGEGGMGVVWMAEQTEPVKRKVALKVIKPGMDSQQVIARFEAERQALAMMDHVNIARVFDGGTTSSGLPYFVMELVHGVPITRYCDDNRLTPRQRLELFVPVCQAIQHAHQKGVIHRDVKPSNVMVTLYDGRPVPKVIDFGVAKATEQRLTERTLFTQYGTMVGTLEYMSPEQAEMSALGVDTRSDIYSLGVLLYELLTGSTPLTHKRMKEAAYAEVLRMITEEEPPRPSTRLSDSGEALASISAQRKTEPAKLSKLMRGELDWIVMKCLEKDRNRRYETANGFAADVQRYLNDEPVQACPPTAWYRFRKFARRNRRALATAALLGGMLVVAMVTLATGLVLVRMEKAETDRQRAIAEEKATRLQHRVYVADLRLGFHHWDRGDVEPLNRILAQYRPQAGQEDLRGFEWHYLDRLARTKPVNQDTFREHKGAVYAALFSPDGKLLASAGEDGTVRLRDVGKPASRILGRHKGEVGFLIFCAKGHTLASAGEDQTVKLWDVGTGNLIDTLHTPVVVGTVGFAPDGRTGAAAGGDGIIRLWDASTRRLLGEMKEPQGKRGHIHFLDHSPDGRRLASCDRNGRMIVWDIEKRRPRLVLQEGGRKVFCICYSPDGSLLASGGEDGLVKLWDAATGRLLISFGQFLNQVRCLHFSPDGARLVESCHNGLVRIWTVPGGTLQGQFYAHPKRVWCTRFAPDGRSLVTASEDGSVKMWRLPDSECHRIILHTGDALQHVTFSSGSRTLAFTTTLGKIGIWERGSGSLDVISKGHGFGRALAFLADGSGLAYGDKSGLVGSLGLTTKTHTVLLPRREMPVGYDAQRWLRQQPVGGLVITPKGKHVAAVDAGGTLRVRGMAGGSVLTEEVNEGTAGLAALAPDGDTLAIWTAKGLRFRGLDRGEWAGRPLIMGPTISAMVFAPDGRALALGYPDGTIRLLDRESGSLGGEFMGHARQVNSLSFAPDGRTLASGSNDGTVRLWALNTREEIATLGSFAGPVYSVQFSPDGSTLAAGVEIVAGYDGLVLWSIDNKEPVKPKKD